MGWYLYKLEKKSVRSKGIVCTGYAIPLQWLGLGRKLSLSLTILCVVCVNLMGFLEHIYPTLLLLYFFIGFYFTSSSWWWNETWLLHDWVWPGPHWVGWLAFRKMRKRGWMLMLDARVSWRWVSEWVAGCWSCVIKITTLSLLLIYLILILNTFPLLFLSSVHCSSSKEEGTIGKMFLMWLKERKKRRRRRRPPWVMEEGRLRLLLFFGNIVFIYLQKCAEIDQRLCCQSKS